MVLIRGEGISATESSRAFVKRNTLTGPLFPVDSPGSKGAGRNPGVCGLPSGRGGKG